MSETKFPKSYANYVEGEGVYSEMNVDFWFKRCMASRPTITPAYKSKWTRGMTGDNTMSGYPIHPTHEDWRQWFKKWFSQFKENSE